MELTLAQAEVFVQNNANAQWDGWNFNIFEPDENGMLMRHGAFFNGKWCIRKSITVNNKGRYFVPKRYIRTTRN
jgi:hypothetical protein